MDTSRLDAGEAELTDADSGELVYGFTLAVSEDDATTPARGSPASSPTHAPTRAPSDAATAQSNRAGTDSTAHGDAGPAGSTVTDSPSPRSTPVTEATTSPDAEPTGSAAERPDRVATTAPGFGSIAVLVTWVAVLGALRRREP